MDKIKGKPLIQSKNHNNLLELLQRAQNKFGGVTEVVMAEVAKSLNISIGEVYGVVTFYSFLSTRTLGRNVIRICRSLPCYLKNSQMMIEIVANELGIGPGETTPDGRFSFELANCIGECDRAPAMLINNNVHFNLTPSKIAEILRSYK